jgi:hypothetical protein
MNLIERARNISLNPRSEWEMIAPETTTTRELYTQYILPLAAIGPLASIVGMSVFGVSLPFVGTTRMPLATVLSMQITNYAVALVGVYLLSLLIGALAPSFGGQRLPGQALKLAAYAFTPAWIAGILLLLPSLSIFALLAGLYGLYLFFLGVTPLMKVPQDKAIGFSAVTVICAVVLSIAGSVLTGAVTAAGTFAWAGSSPSGTADAPKGLENFAQQMAEVQRQAERVAANAKNEAIAEKADPVPGAKAMQVEVVHQDTLRALLPEHFANFSRKNIDASKVDMGALTVSEAKANYEDAAAKQSIEISISDMGAKPLGGLMGIWGVIEKESDNDQEYSKTGKVDGRPVDMMIKKDHSRGEYSTLIGDRFVVAVKGISVGLEELKAAANAVPAARLEAMKNEGVKR